MGSSFVLASRGVFVAAPRTCRATVSGLGKEPLGRFGDFPSDTRWGVWILRLISHFSWSINVYNMLVGGLEFGTFFIFPYIGNVIIIIPTDFHIFQRG